MSQEGDRLTDQLKVPVLSSSEIALESSEQQSNQVDTTRCSSSLQTVLKSQIVLH